MPQPRLKEMRIGALAKTVIDPYSGQEEGFFVVDPVMGCILMLELAFVSYLDPETAITHYGEGKPHNPDSENVPHLSERINWLEFK